MEPDRQTLTFSDAVDRYLGGKLDEFRNEKHRKQRRSTLDTYAVPVLGRMPINKIEVQNVLRVLQPIWLSKTETASRLHGRIEAVLSWATVAGHRTGDNPARWKSNLSEMLPKSGRVAKKEHHPAVALAEARPRRLSLPAARQCRDHLGGELHVPRRRPGMSDAPKLLLDHHLKTLKLPTFLREYAKLARPAA